MDFLCFEALTPSILCWQVKGEKETPRSIYSYVAKSNNKLDAHLIFSMFVKPGSQPSAFKPTGFYAEDSGQEQNVPQQIDLTEDDDVEDAVEGVGNEVDEDEDVVDTEDNGDLNYQLDEGTGKFCSFFDCHNDYFLSGFILYCLIERYKIRSIRSILK